MKPFIRLLFISLGLLILLGIHRSGEAASGQGDLSTHQVLDQAAVAIPSNQPDVNSGGLDSDNRIVEKYNLSHQCIERIIALGNQSLLQVFKHRFKAYLPEITQIKGHLVQAHSLQGYI